MWFATKDGLNRYDGYQFKVYTHDSYDPKSISSYFAKVFRQEMGITPLEWRNNA